MSQEAFGASCSSGDWSGFLLAQGNPGNHFDTLIIHETGIEGSGDAVLTRLASFPQLIPNPIIEMDSEGNVTYLNPAASRKFPRLREIGKEHPILAELGINCWTSCLLLTIN